MELLTSVHPEYLQNQPSKVIAIAVAAVSGWVCAVRGGKGRESDFNCIFGYKIEGPVDTKKIK